MIPPDVGQTQFAALMKHLEANYWNDQAFVARTIAAIGSANVASVLNRKAQEERRTTPPSRAEITALETTLWDNWKATAGKRPKEGQPDHDKARFKVSVEMWNQPEGQAMWGKGTKAPNSIFAGTAIAMDRAALLAYLRDKREGKKIAVAWATGTDLGAFADELEGMSDAKPDALIGPLCWTSNKKLFVPGMWVMVDDQGTKDMVATVILPDGYYQAKRWTSQRADGTRIPDHATQCRATSRPDQTHWRNAKL